MAKLEHINVDGTLYDIGGEDYTAGTNITITEGVIAAPNVYTKAEVNALLAAIVDGDNLSYGS